MHFRNPCSLQHDQFVTSGSACSMHAKDVIRTVRRGKPVVSDMVYSPRSDCLVVRHEDNDKAFYRGIIVLDLAAGGRMLHSVDDLGCARIRL